MKKYQKILMMSAVFLASAQGILVSASELVTVSKENETPISSSFEESSTSASQNKSETSGEDQSTLDSLDEEDNFNVNSESSAEEEDAVSGAAEAIRTTERPKVAARSIVGTYQQPLENGTLPKVSIRLGELPVKNSGTPFKDISQSLFKNYINWIYSRGITTGYTATTYNPDAKVTRGEMAVFLHRLASAPGYQPPFNVYTDVSQYKTQILWLTAATVSNGTAPHYNPNGHVTRGQMAAFLHRMAKVSNNAPASGKYGSNFGDAQNHMFANDIGWLSSKGITTGYTPTSFRPDAEITRGEMAAFLYRFYNVTINKQNPYPAGQCTAYVWEYFNGNIPTYMGNAKDWVKYANSKPAPGTIAVFPPGNQGAGSLGHLAVVLSVSGSRMRVSEGNYNGGWGTERDCSTAGVKFIRP